MEQMAQLFTERLAKPLITGTIKQKLSEAKEFGSHLSSESREPGLPKCAAQNK